MIEIWKMCLIIVALLCVMVLGMVYYYRWLARKVNRTMVQVDDTIESLIHHRKVHHFSEAEDTLLGKFQHEILQLDDMLHSYEEREKSLRKSLNSSISDLVHQINTPITNIKMYSGFLMEQGLEEEQRRVFAENIIQQAEKLSWLGEGFSKLSRLEEGIITLQPESQPILPVLLRAIDQISLKAQKHGNDIRLEGNRKLRAELDGKWTEEVFYNLLDNAVKYSDEGSAITVELMQLEMYSRINVVDYGMKLRKDEYPNVFKRFYRGRQVKGQDGVGLGLYLAREIIRKQRGYIKVEERNDKAIVFAVFLPTGFHSPVSI